MIITGYRFTGSNETCTPTDNRSWTPVVGESAAVLRHELTSVANDGVVPITHEGGVKVTAVRKTVIRTSDGRAWDAHTKLIRSGQDDDAYRRGPLYLHPMA